MWNSPLTQLALHHRLLLWTCPGECDYTCQHIVTDDRLTRDPPYMQPVHQFHGKWPFWRFLGMQEPFSVLFSLANFWAHWWGMSKIRERVPEHYPLRKYYEKYAYLGYAAWTFSAVFHARDFLWTERFDYLGAGAYVLYGLYFAPIRIFRLYEPGTAANPGMNASLLRIWTGLCISLYAMHAGYLLLVEWNYTYNMAANIVVGLCHSIFWAVFSLRLSFQKGLGWRAWPGFIVAMIISVMALELLDFPPWGRMVDAHSLWHLGTVLPTMWWYKYDSR